MEEQRNERTRPVNPRRRKRSKMRIFKEVYLPVIIAGLALLLILVFIVGAIVRAVQKGKIDKQASIDASVSMAAEDQQIAGDVQKLLAEADRIAASVDYDGAIALLDSFTGDTSKHPEIAAKRDAYTELKNSMVAWEDPSQIPNLSFQLLIADPARAFTHKTHADSFKRNFITTEEFSRILQQLYENGYMLVRPSDFITAETGADGATVYKYTPLYLPNGKKPLVLTQTNVNYNLYMVDGDGDKIPDKDGGGFASKLVLDQNGNITCMMVDAEGQTATGAYDLVPILNEFVSTHPDFSYKGSKAVLALTGYDGLFGYRASAEADAASNEKMVATIKEIATTLQDSGYTLGCYTYENIPYGESGLETIKADIGKWNKDVVPILGQMDILVYAQKSDITTEKDYSGDKFTALQEAGFRYYMGFCTDGKPWAIVNEQYVRQGRILVTAENLSQHADWFTTLFDASAILDSSRNAASS